jgi:membrane-associated progesterone receptor component
MQPPAENLAPPKDDPFTPEQLADFDGSDPSKPIYVAIKGALWYHFFTIIGGDHWNVAWTGDIFDVTHKVEVYGKGKSYNIFAGKDGSKGLGLSSLKPEDAISDYSDLGEKEAKVLDDWHSFFS